MANEQQAAPAAGMQRKLSLKRQLVFWAAALFAFALFLWVFSDVLLPFIVAMGLAYLLDPVVERMRGLGINRTLATLLIVVGTVLLIIAALVLLIPLLSHEIAQFAQRLPHYFQQLQDYIARSQHTWFGQLIGGRLPEIQKSLSGMAAQAAGWAGAFLASLWTGGKALVSVLSLLIIAPVVTFYLLLDWDRVVARIDDWIPLHHKTTVRQLLSEVDTAIAGFMRGQALCCVILGVFYAAGLVLIGLNFGLMIGIVAGVLSFVPYVGTMIGFLLAGGVAIAQFWPEWFPILMAVGVFAIGQAIEGNVLQPYFVGTKIGLHPVWLMFSLLAFGYLFGFVGLLVAVPVAASIGVLARFLIRQYLASPYYTGG